MQSAAIRVKLIQTLPASKYLLGPPHLRKSQESSIVRDLSKYQGLQRGMVMALQMTKSKNTKWTNYKQRCLMNGTVSRKDLVNVEKYGAQIFATGVIAWRVELQKGEDLTASQKEQCPTWAATAETRKLRWQEKEKGWKKSKGKFDSARIIVWCLEDISILESGVEIMDESDIVSGGRMVGWYTIKPSKERELAEAARRLVSRAGSPQV